LTFLLFHPFLLSKHTSTKISAKTNSETLQDKTIVKEYISTTIMRNYHLLDCRYEGGVVQAEKGTTSLPLAGHPVHVPETGVQTARQDPLGVVVLLVPGNPCHADIDHIVDLIVAPAPGTLNGSAPGFGHDGRDSQVGSNPVLEDATID
jgi:hypothetical protein